MGISTSRILFFGFQLPLESSGKIVSVIIATVRREMCWRHYAVWRRSSRRCAERMKILRSSCKGAGGVILFNSLGWRLFSYGSTSTPGGLISFHAYPKSADCIYHQVKTCAIESPCQWYLRLAKARGVLILAQDRPVFCCLHGWWRL